VCLRIRKPKSGDHSDSFFHFFIFFFLFTFFPKTQSECQRSFGLCCGTYLVWPVPHVQFENMLKISFVDYIATSTTGPLVPLVLCRREKFLIMTKTAGTAWSFVALDADYGQCCVYAYHFAPAARTAGLIRGCNAGARNRVTISRFSTLKKWFAEHE
jgi:hypothetical protein